MMKLHEVTEPVVTITRDKHHRTCIYVLSGGKDCFKVPKAKEGEYMVKCGPAIVVEHNQPSGPKIQCHPIDDPRLWAWLGTLLRAGQWALSDKRAAAYLPEEFVASSARFAGTTQKQRESMKDRLPPTYTKQRPARGRRFATRKK